MINLKVRSVMMSIWLCLQALSSALVNKNDGVLKSKHDFSARNPHDFRTLNCPHSICQSPLFQWLCLWEQGEGKKCKKKLKLSVHQVSISRFPKWLIYAVYRAWKTASTKMAPFRRVIDVSEAFDGRWQEPHHEDDCFSDPKIRFHGFEKLMQVSKLSLVLGKASRLVKVGNEIK